MAGDDGGSSLFASAAGAGAEEILVTQEGLSTREPTGMPSISFMPSFMPSEIPSW